MQTRLAMGALAACCLSIVGCIKAERFSVIEYDTQRDVYRHLRVYCNIRTSEPPGAGRNADLAHLTRLWEQRDELLLVKPGVIPVFGDTEEQWLRTGPRAYRTISLGKPRAGTEEDKTPANQTELNLAEFGVRPGRFFLSNEQSLCYYHQTEIPGVAVDWLLKETQAEWSEGLQTAAREEQARRIEGGAERWTWDELRRVLKAMARERELVDEPPALPLISILDDESLRLLAQAAERNAVTLGRKGGQLTFQFAISAKDAGQLLGVVAQVQADLRGRHWAWEPLDRWLQQLGRLAQVRQTEGQVTATLSVLSLFNDEPLRRTAFTADQVEPSLAVVEEVRQRNLPIDTSRSLEEIVEAFREGKLE